MLKSKNNVKGFYAGAKNLGDYLSEKDRYLSKNEKPKYKFNIIGAGNIGKEHINVTMMEGRGTVHGIYDTSEKSAAGTKEMFQEYYPGHGLVVYKTLEEACSDTEVDGLIICTPNFTHIGILKEALKTGKHILLEKPMATTVADAYAIKEMAESYGSVLQIGLQYRYKPIYVEAVHEALERKSVGDLKTISILEHRIPFLDKVGQWNKFSKYSGGTFIEKCCHYFDLFNLFAQSKPVEVYATGGAAVNFTEFEYEGNPSDIIDNAFVNITYENGVRANFNLCMFSPMFYEELILYGDEGRLKASESENFSSLPANRNHLELIRADGAPSKTMTPAYSAEIEASGHGGSSYYEQVHFINSIEGTEVQTVTADEGFWSIVVGSAAEASLREGKVINIEEHLVNNGIIL